MQMTFGHPCERVVTAYKLRTTGSSPFVYLLPSWPVGFLALPVPIPFPQKTRLIHLQFRNPNDPVGGGVFGLKPRLLAFVSIMV